jgi:hypothetical protein
MPDGITPESSDLDPAAFFQGIREAIEDEVDNVSCFFVGETFLFGQGVDQIRLVHMDAPVISMGEENRQNQC